MAHTIAAVSTAPGMAGIAVLRVSGPAAGTVVSALIGRMPQPRQAILTKLNDPVSRETLDVALVLWFPGPRSFTGQDVAEFHVHGGRAVVAGVLSAILAIDGVRAAEPGEFTRRAFENGKLDLASVEGLSDLLTAETQAQRRQAFAQYQGRIGSVTDRLQVTLTRALALVETSIDFSDEGDVSSAIVQEARGLVTHVADSIRRHMADAGRGERIRDGVTIAIAGPPNAGKSTLLNSLSGRDVAIVSPIAGTTRDVIEVHLDLHGVAVVLLDMAGIREASDAVEAEGIRRARDRLHKADLILWLDPRHAGAAAGLPDAVPVWNIRSQIDRVPGLAANEAGGRSISAVTGEGLAELIQDLGTFAANLAGGEPAVLVRERHRQTFADALSHSDAALSIADWDEAADIVAEHLRLASLGLARGSGRVGAEAILDVIFSSFCIGK
ncbi:tRNA uridine-5-carboxymethylaminomethyl(34) synthesis GTPase MnmE [Phreatobacter aquaticus]|uniref:tRNA modification GTPase MnmE n=1 Tax=Phreatobacter aquaticus TaxID=2570229 RepID=A0A4D7QRN8_9HYPH|nr:tRNA uridine-5-carboxymethylaminomethyl(34) synthesis GTPase MnmE [Phreatobacter aquaticus]